MKANGEGKQEKDKEGMPGRAHHPIQKEAQSAHPFIVGEIGNYATGLELELR
jgi:hypothetical protein